MSDPGGHFRTVDYADAPGFDYYIPFVGRAGSGNSFLGVLCSVEQIVPRVCPKEGGRYVEPIFIPYLTRNYAGWFEVCPCGYVFDRHPPDAVEWSILLSPRVITVDGYAEDGSADKWTAGDDDGQELKGGES